MSSVSQGQSVQLVLLCVRCRRLGLTPLAYLWRRDQEELLGEMIDCGLQAIFIKVAALGGFLNIRKCLIEMRK